MRTSGPKRGCFVRLDVTAKELRRKGETKMCKELKIVKVNSWYPPTKQFRTLEDHKCFLVSYVKNIQFSFYQVLFVFRYYRAECS